MSDITARLVDIVGSANVLTGDAIPDDYSHDEELTQPPQRPAYVVKPATAEEVSRLLTAASDHRTPVTARGSGCGLSGAARPCEDGLLISFERMNRVLEIDTANQVAVVQPGLTLTELDAATVDSGLGYMVHPGELSSSVGGNVGTNAGGMRAVKYGIARHNVLGLQAVLPTGEIIRTGGKIAKVSSGYDLTQLIVGSEGTLALATEVIVKLHPRLDHSASVLAPFADFDQVMAAVPKIVASGLAPYILEYIDNLTMAALVHTQNLELGIPDQVRDSCQAYLLVGSRESHRRSATRGCRDGRRDAGRNGSHRRLRTGRKLGAQADRGAREGVLGGKSRGCRRHHRHRRAARVDAEVPQRRTRSGGGRGRRRDRLRPRRRRQCAPGHHL